MAEPVRLAARSGATENEKIASSAKRIILESGYFVSPAWRVSRSYRTSAARNPAHGTMPRKNRWRSRIACSAPSTFRLMSRKSRSSGMGTPQSRRITR